MFDLHCYLIRRFTKPMPLVSALQDAQRTGAVPLLFRADVPLRVELGSLKLWKVTSRVKCDIVMDRLMDVTSPIKIKTSNASSA
jgi:hypothetical protein